MESMERVHCSKCKSFQPERHMFMAFATEAGLKIYLCEDCITQAAGSLCPGTIKKLYENIDAVNIEGRDY